jgi:hypothetical protein
VFPAIGGHTVRIDDLVSITELCNCSNEREREEDELTGKGLAAVRDSSRWRKLDLRGAGNSRARVNDYG